MRRDVEPGYFRAYPTYPAVAELRKVCGVQDSQIEMNEVFLRSGIQAATSSPLGFNDFLRQLAKNHGVTVGPVDLSQLTLRTHQMNVIQVHLMGERFFNDILSQYGNYKRLDTSAFITQDGSGNLSPLGRVQKNAPNASSLDVPEAELIEYYRLVRNHLVHRSPSMHVLARAQQGIRDKHEQHFGKYSPLAVPNLPLTLDFSDFMLFTRSLKYFANLVNDAFALTPSEVASAISDEPALWRKVKERNRQSSRLHGLAQAYIQMYHLTEPDFSQELASELQKLLDG